MYYISVGGVTIICPTRENKLSPITMEHKATWILGGRAATEMVYGIPDAGSNSDLQKAYDIIWDITASQAMSGFEGFERMDHMGNTIDAQRDVIIASHMEKCYKKAKKILADNWPVLKALLDTLRKEKILTSKDIRKIIDAIVVDPVDGQKEEDDLIRRVG